VLGWKHSFSLGTFIFNADKIRTKAAISSNTTISRMQPTGTIHDIMLQVTENEGSTAIFILNTTVLMRSGSIRPHDSKLQGLLEIVEQNSS
jgi:hypothetical protein